MRTVEFECTIAAPLETVWAFYQNVPKSIPALMPREDQVQVELAETPHQVGSRVIFSMRGPFGPIRWIGRYTEFVPPHAVAFGEEGRYVDEQVEGPFKSWRHAHEFEAINSHTTRIVDRITYQPPYAPFGWLIDLFVVRPRLKKVFAHRQIVLKNLLEKPPKPVPHPSGYSNV